MGPPDERSRQALAAEVDASLATLAPDDVAAVEHIAATYALAFRRPGDEPGTASLLVGALLERGDERAAAVLHGLAEVGDAEVAAPARAALEALGARGVAWPHAPAFGEARVEEAWVEPEARAEVVWLLVARPGGRTQLAWFVLRSLKGRELLVGGELRAPADDAVVRRALAAADGDEAPAAVEVAAALDRVLAAAEVTAAAGRAVTAALGAALLLVARAAGRRAPALDVDVPDDLVRAPAMHVQPGDEAAMYRSMDELLDDFAPFVRSRYGNDGPQWRVGDLVGGAMVEFRGRADGRLGHWTAALLRAFLLEWFPRRVAAELEIYDDVPAAVVAFLTFLDDRMLLDGEPADTLVAAAEELAAPFREMVRRPPLLPDSH